MMKRVWCALIVLGISGSLIAQEDKKFAPYSEQIPGSDVELEMVPIPGDNFIMGSPETEANREADEGPQQEITIDPFWMGKYEITWDIFELFMDKNKLDLEAFQASLSDQQYSEADAITRPSAPYEDPTFGMGKRGYPAVSMTQYAAMTFCKWLSSVTGHFYRLPTEAEWEYACRAGAETAFYHGNDMAELDEYAWHFENSEYTYHQVGQKRPNAFGLYDMMGNVAEWTLDQYIDTYFVSLEEKGLENPWIEPTALYPRTVRGGSYIDDPDVLRCANRLESDDKRWKERDPQIPKSFWWNTDSPFVGFRVVRPLHPPTEEEIDAFWSRTLDE